MRFALSLLCLLLASPAAAGPWPREAGSWFLSTAFGTERQNGRRVALTDSYLEYGLTPRLTFGGSLRRVGTEHEGRVFARWHPPDLPGGIPVGLSLGLQQGDGPDWRATEDLGHATVERLVLRPRAVLGLHLGHGRDTPLGPAWARLDLRVFVATGGPRGTDLELFGQIGLRPRERLVTMLSASLYTDRTDRWVTLEPAVGYEITPRFTLLASVTAEPSRRSLRSAQLGLWTRF
jgi:hypothetical protein